MRYLYMDENVVVFFHHDPKQEHPYIIDNAWATNGILMLTGGRDYIHPTAFEQAKNDVLTIVTMYEGGYF